MNISDSGARLRRVRLGGAVLLTAVAGTVCAQSVELDTDEKKFSYFMGVQAGNQLKQRGMAPALDADAMALGIRDAIEGKESRVSVEEIQQVGQKIQAMAAAQQQAAGSENAERAKTFLAGNKAADGVTTTDSGVQYKVIRKGEGAKPTAEQQVIVHYRGALLNGTEFDSSYRRGEPAKFGVSQVIPGWQEALKLMSQGAKWEVWIPPELAYGEQGAGGRIGPNEALHFTIELLEVGGG